MKLTEAKRDAIFQSEMEGLTRIFDRCDEETEMLRIKRFTAKREAEERDKGKRETHR